MRQLTTIIFLIITVCLQAQTSLYEKYIHKYDDYAVSQMKRYGIPASITLAQGLLESAAGTSRLATKGNNHFGIKAGSDWHGKYMLMDDDAPNERFRVYRSAKDSYEDHSKFLYGKKRYASLFRLSPKDYKGWAYGLKKAGYATNPRYANMLIELIERYDLHRYDGKRYSAKKEKELPFGGRTIHCCNKSFYIIAQAGDTYESLSKIMKKSARRLRKYNEVDKHYQLSPGDIVYLQSKQTKANKCWKQQHHTIRPGESVYSIAQQYGMKIETLYKINKLTPDYQAQAGDALLIRK